MNIGHYFIDRPRSAAVISIFIVLVGAIAYGTLPVSQYPEISPPTVVVRAVYPGATAEVVAQTVATPIEQEVNGVEGMLYMTSQATSDGVMSLNVVFDLGTDLDTAQVLVQNRISVAEPRLPEEVRRIGVTTAKSSPDLMMVVHLESPNDTYDTLYISNYALLQVRDVLARIDGIGNINVFGAREYSMRVWLDPDRLTYLSLTASDVVRALRAQNVQVAGGTLGEPPIASSTAFQIAVNTQGRFIAAEEFENVIVKRDENSVVRVKDVGRVELGARDYITNSYLNGKPAIALAIFQRPGSNALATAAEIQRTMAELAEDFPAGLAYRIAYNPTEFIQQSVDAVYSTIVEAVLLVIFVIVLFLQSWRAAAIPIVAIPVSLIGTFAVMAALGFSLNNLTLFGLVLAIGIVVDDAIVVVENIERNLASGLDAREAARVTMTEVGPALVSIALVLERRIRADGVPRRHLRRVLSAIRADDRGRDDHLRVGLADVEPGARRDLAAPRRGARRRLRPTRRSIARADLQGLQLRVRQAQRGVRGRRLQGRPPPLRGARCVRRAPRGYGRSCFASCRKASFRSRTRAT